MAVGMTEEEKRLNDLRVQARTHLFAVLRELVQSPEDVSFLPRIVEAMTFADMCEREHKSYYLAKGQTREQTNQARMEEEKQRQAMAIKEAKARAAEINREKKSQAGKIYREKRAEMAVIRKQKKVATRESRIEAEAQKTKAESRELNVVKLTAAAARTELLKAQAEADSLHKLALEGRKKAIIQIALASGDLEEITEDRIEAVANTQRRSNGGVVRIESGSGR